MGSRTRARRGECMDMNRRKYYVARGEGNIPLGKRETRTAREEKRVSE